VFTACGEHPGGGWAAQQARNLAWELQEAEVKPRFLIHDRDSKFPAAFDTVLRAEGLEVIRTPVGRRGRHTQDQSPALTICPGRGEEETGRIVVAVDPLG
jgi:hypothetical protein